MNVLHERCAGLDLADDGLIAGIRIQTGKQIHEEHRGFATHTRGLLELVDWLSGHGITHVVMEATGSYWRAVWQILESHFELMLANARDVKTVPGRKSDVNDALWLAGLHAHGLLRPSFVPPVSIQDLRDLTRTRTQLIREIVQHTQRIQKVLDTANIKLTAVASDIKGVSCRAMIRAIIRGETDPEVLAGMALGRLKSKHDLLIEALRGRVRPHHRAMLELHLDIIESLERSVVRLEERIEAALLPFRRQRELLVTMPGISMTSAAVLIAELGVDMSQFGTARRLISWACLCPGLDITGGRPKSTRTRKGAKWLKAQLVQCAQSAIKKKDSYYKSLFHRICARRGANKAKVAVAAAMLTAIFHMLENDVPYHDLGSDHFVRNDRERAAKRLVHQLNRLGYTVQIEAA